MNSLGLIISIILLLLVILAAVLVFLLIPIILSRSPYLLRKTLFTTGGAATNKLYYDRNTKPGVRNFYITFQDETGKDINIGAYHFLPKEYILNQTEDIPPSEYERLLNNSPYNVLLLFHGRGQSRASFGNKYEMLSSIFHVIVFDYRCFGDSSKAILSEYGLVRDCVHIFKWLRNRTSSSIYVWGQSLGSALCIETVYMLNKENIIPKGMILEASFTTLREAVLDSPVGRIFSWVPWFSSLLDGYESNGFVFKSSIHLTEIRCPVMIMHAVDDEVIPFNQGMKLYEVVIRRPIKINIAKFLPIAASYRCGHDFIYKFPNFTSQIMDFMTICDSEFNMTEGI
ncbi:lysophosphatidylserine lipase ABHD12-like [Coccinella septempunctata]|uniref:lysophosphatidylserine lipase ABHD12-like n=1 Tax=Coccinella septempunctata TaxID=41139 RepID=UPI001D0849B7|nr:lysophosphatidylserine lipase ABHD12-like [Coccinella septempunctata]